LFFDVRRCALEDWKIGLSKLRIDDPLLPYRVRNSVVGCMAVRLLRSSLFAVVGPFFFLDHFASCEKSAGPPFVGFVLLSGIAL